LRAVLFGGEFDDREAAQYRPQTSLRNFLDQFEGNATAARASYLVLPLRARPDR